MLHVHRTVPRVRPRRRARRGRRGPVWPEVAAGRRHRARPRATAPRWSPVRRRVLGAVLAMTATVVALVATPSRPADGRERRPAQPSPSPIHLPPVDAPIADPFRPPTGPYGAGNRGLDYDTTAGDVVRASAAGTVVFAGPVAGSLHVTVRHADGVRTSYSFLEAVSTIVGATVAAGDPVGTAGEHLHFGARAGDAYFDPAALFGGAATVELLPFEVPPGSTPDAEARALVGIAFSDGRGLSVDGPGPGDGMASRPGDRRCVRAGGRPGARRRRPPRPRPVGGLRPRRSTGVPAPVLDRPTTGPPGGP